MPGVPVAQHEQVEHLEHVFDQFQEPMDHFQHQGLQVHERRVEDFNIDQVLSTINEQDQAEVESDDEESFVAPRYHRIKAMCQDIDDLRRSKRIQDKNNKHAASKEPERH